MASNRRAATRCAGGWHHRLEAWSDDLAGGDRRPSSRCERLERPALLLDDGFPDGPLSPEVSHDEWCDRFETLGDWSAYWSVYDMEGPEAGKASEHVLDDDLADVWRDPTSGLRGLDAGIEPEAVAWEWHEGHATHRGRHAVQASRALHHRRFG